MRNRIKKILAVYLVMVTLVVFTNAPVLAETSVGEALTETQEDIGLNREVTINWEKNGDTVDYYFTPTETKKYLFVVTDNDDRFPALWQGDDEMTWETFFSETDGKIYLRTPVLEAGTTYDIYFKSRSGEKEVTVGFYDDIWYGSETLKDVATADLKKGYLDDGSYWARTKRYMFTPTSDGTYKFLVSGLNASGITDENDYDFNMRIYDENGDTLEKQINRANLFNDSEAYVTANLKAGNNYYVVLRNFSDINDYAYKLEATYIGLSLNDESNVSWNGLGRDFYCFFTPEKTQQYVFTVTDSVDRMPSLAYTNGTWKQIIYDVNGKVRLITPVLEAGKEYALYVPKAKGETSVQIGFYDSIGAEINTLKTPYTDTIGAGTVRYGEEGRYPSNRIYKLTVPVDAEYTYSISWPKNFSEEAFQYGISASVYDENFSCIATEVKRNSNDETAILGVTAKLKEGKTYYLMVSNHSKDSGVEYRITHCYVNPDDSEDFINGTEGNLTAQGTKLYKVVINEDGVYEFMDTKATKDRVDFSIYDDGFNNITSKSQKNLVVKYNEKNEKNIESVSRKIQLSKGIYYVQFSNFDSKATEYKLQMKKQTFVDVDSIQITPSKLEIEEGSKKNIKVKISPDNATFITRNWKVSDDSIAYLEYNDDNDNVNVVGLKEGECDITATALNGKIAVCHVVVKKAGDHKYEKKVIKATTSKDGKVVNECSNCGHVETIQVISHPKQLRLSKNNYVYDGKVKTPSIVVVDANGKTISSSNYVVSYDKGRKDAGTYNVKVTFKGNYTGTMTTKFQIAKASQELKITAPKKSMKVGSSVKVKISTNKNHGKVTYKVSNSKIATVKNGKIKAIKKGKVKLTVTLKGTKNYKEKKVTLTIKVK